ncbi:ARM repeat-containing protein [Durotheca rogersii]|uniref:ARM repeat-containing protein n=1 Tax=Durotheca rogersii TaxID=419775 RepID=UPI0022201ACA|nr:ARM repeat-containing protein [Durotheca rogersii]KAI5867654.1 ARM repeat-containing protein [Durotheca rogersii]
MNAEAVRARIVATLSPDANVRRAAEIDLKQAEGHPGFTDVLLDVLSAEPEDAVRLSTVIYLKNRTNRGWSRSDHYPDDPLIAEDEKQRFRDRILPILAASRGPVRQQLLQLIQRILHFDFPGKWPSFMDVTLQLLHSNDAPSVLAGLQCLLVTCRAYRFKGAQDNSRAEFDKIIEASFPRLQQICNELVNQQSDEAGEMLHIALKAYKHATWLELSSFLRRHDVNIGWCTIFLHTVSKSIPPSAMAEDIEERERHHWWKAKKWAYFNLNRLWIRHGNLQAVTTKNNETTRYAKEFENTIAPEVLKHYLQEIEKWVSKTAWLSKPCLSYTLVFLDECCRPKSMWALMYPHLTNLVTHLVFPVMCLSSEDVQKFEDEPEEYLHRKLNFYEEVSAPDVAATNFLVTLTKSRRKQTFEILQFVNRVVTEYEQAADDKKNHIAKEGALRMIGTLAPVLLGKKSPVADQIEYFLVRYVFPDFKSPLGYLRARACDTIEKFEQLNFNDQNNLLIVYRHILDCMADTDLPVRVTAALALQPLIRHDAIRISMQQSIPTIMQQLLKLANECDIDALANVMEDFVEVFATELTPFAVALSEQLRETYLRIIRELLDKNDARNGDDDFGDYLDDKSITALGVLQTIGTLILTLENTPDVLLHIEAVLMPVIQVTLENKLYDLYNEVFEIIDSCTFAAKSISVTMWQAFELIHATFKSGAELYLEDMLPALDNFVQYGAGHLIQKPEYVQALYGMVEDMFQDSKVSGVDRICACKLAEAMMLSLRGNIDQSVTGFITMAMIVLSGHDAKVKSYKIHLMEMVINAIYYNPVLTLAVLEGKGWTNKFFSLWFGNMDHFSRVHDKKLCIVAIVSLLNLNADQIPASVSTGWPRLLQGITGLFKTLPNALKNREQALKEDFAYDSNNYDYEDEDEWADEDTNWNAEEGAEAEQVDARDESTAYLEFLNEEAAKFTQIENQYKEQGEESDEELGEDSVLLESPLDKIEPYQLFRGVLLKVQQENPQLYSSLTANLSADEQSVIQTAIHQAEAHAQAALQMAAQAAHNPQGVPNGGAR